MNENGSRRRSVAMFVVLWTGLTLLPFGGRPEPAAARTGSTVKSECPPCTCLCTSGCGCATISGKTTCEAHCFICEACLQGVAGGGVVAIGSRQATVALSATKAKPNKNGRPVGVLRWVDADFEGTPLTLESIGFSGYGPVDALPNTREAKGFVLADGAGPFPFRLIVTLGEADEQDSVTLTVGDAVEGFSETGFSYAAEGPLVAGDLVGTWMVPEE